uniref:Phosphoglycolate phosphatase n=1 Tax=Candidatus Kentrum eta TaxID=2126337 RepID=A0A450UGU2_9GAMM|nr:MAG: phosphoglycolate phosphatase [Candidatus Kentron sp. H]VFJ92963.1 MAG: phosphoglycolate phosphatase [Candidatus Kentron sp. H]VFJ99571.1 MAG: phosphoglycolate phosphatase [Candidatus Kentron sp. H]
MTFPRPKLVVFDLDGTLVDSVPDIAKSADEMLIRVGMAPHGEAKVRQWIGNGIERLVRRALTDSMDGEPDAALFARAYPLFLQCYDEHNGRRSTIYPGALAALEFLDREGIPLACITNKAARFTEPLLARLGLRDRFGLVVSGDTLPRKKPDPMPLLHVADRFGVPPGNALLVGDSLSDVKAARAAGFGVVAVTYGYNHGLDIRGAGPDVAMDSLGALAGLFTPR